MLTRITLSGKWAKRVCADGVRSFEFKPGVNLLVGPNGSGKSSILSGIMKFAGKLRRKEEDAEVAIGLVPGKGVFSVKMFDFEKQNPRVTNSLHGGESSFMFQASSMFSSHGEANRALGTGLIAIDDVRDALILLDEPDQALDFDGIGELIENLKRTTARQALVAVHHPRIVCCRDFNCVEMVDGYRDRIRLEMLKLVEGDQP
jgi:ABC-type cobalamin/Fe3+-siderophores transport system ATPase subunit